MNLRHRIKRLETRGTGRPGGPCPTCGYAGPGSIVTLRVVMNAHVFQRGERQSIEPRPEDTCPACGLRRELRLGPPAGVLDQMGEVHGVR